ncbi:hypothetical protein SLA2020_360370 [Shorea laevis]
MEDYIFKILAILASGLLIVYPVIRVVYVIWWRPKSLEKQLRQQGIRGTSYKLLHGDRKEIKKYTREALSKPMTLDHQISPRASPFFHQMVHKYGKVSLSWNGTRPRLTVGEPEIMRRGLARLEGERWAKHRRLITPAFHLDKLKRMVPAFETSCSGLIDRWEKLIGPQGSREIDVAPEFQNLASDVIARTAFGSSFEEGKRIFELLRELTKLVFESFNKIYIPGFRFIPTKKNKGDIK